MDSDLEEWLEAMGKVFGTDRFKHERDLQRRNKDETAARMRMKGTLGAMSKNAGGHDSEVPTIRCADLASSSTRTKRM